LINVAQRIHRAGLAAPQPGASTASIRAPPPPPSVTWPVQPAPGPTSEGLQSSCPQTRQIRRLGGIHDPIYRRGRYPSSPGPRVRGLDRMNSVALERISCGRGRAPFHPPMGKENKTYPIACWCRPRLDRRPAVLGFCCGAHTPYTGIPAGTPPSTLPGPSCPIQPCGTACYTPPPRLSSASRPPSPGPRRRTRRRRTRRRPATRAPCASTGWTSVGSAGEGKLLP